MSRHVLRLFSLLNDLTPGPAATSWRDHSTGVAELSNYNCYDCYIKLHLLELNIHYISDNIQIYCQLDKD